MFSSCKRNGVPCQPKVCSQRSSCKELHVSINHADKCIGCTNVFRLLHGCYCRIDLHFIIKIADFGLSENIYDRNYVRQGKDTAGKLPVKWMALESLLDLVFSEKTDVVRLKTNLTIRMVLYVPLESY